MERVATLGEAALHDEKRRSGRQTFICKGLLYGDENPGRPQQVQIKDVSKLGIGFESARPVEPGSQCRIDIELGPTRVAWRLRAVCCGKIDQDLYRLGCEFLTVEPEPSLFDLGDDDVELGNEEQVLLLR